MGKKARATSAVQSELESIYQEISKPNLEAKSKTVKPGADAFFGVVILLNTIFLGIEVELNRDPVQIHWGFWGANSAFLIVFLIEICFRAVVERPRKFFCSSWGFFDCTVTALGIIDVWVITPLVDGSGSELSSITVLRLFRLFRLVRVVRVFRFCQDLVLLIGTVGDALRAVFWMGLLLAGVTFAGGVFCCVLLKSYEEEEVARHFSSLGRSFYTHFVLITTEGWADVALGVMGLCGASWGLYFVGFVTVTSFALLNLVIGVVTEKMMRADQDDLTEDQLRREIDEFRSVLLEMFVLADTDHTEGLNLEELRRVFEDPCLRRVLEAFKVNTAMPFNFIWPIIDWNGDGQVTFEEFLGACLRLRGSKGKANLQILVLQSDLNRNVSGLRRACRDVSTAADEQLASIDSRVSGVEQTLHHLAEVLPHLPHRREGCADLKFKGQHAPT